MEKTCIPSTELLTKEELMSRALVASSRCRVHNVLQGQREAGWSAACQLSTCDPHGSGQIGRVTFWGLSFPIFQSRQYRHLAAVLGEEEDYEASLVTYKGTDLCLW